MTDEFVNGDGNFKDWIYMDTYRGSDVPITTAFGISKVKSLRAFLMNGPKGGNSWDRKAEFWTTANFDPSTKLDKSSVVNDLATGGIDKVLSAEQGKVLKSLLDSVSGDSSGGLVKDSKSYSKILHTGDLTANGKDITVGKKLYFPALFLDGVRIDESEFDVNHAGGVITLKQPYANYQVTWVIVDMLPNHIKFAYPTLNMLKADEGIKKLINLGDVIEILGESDADDGGHRLVKCENSSKLNGVDIGGGRFLNEIPNTRMDSKQNKVDNRLQTHNKEIVKAIDEQISYLGKTYKSFPLTSATQNELYYHAGSNKMYICTSSYSGSQLSNPNGNFEELGSYSIYKKLTNLIKIEEMVAGEKLELEQEICFYASIPANKMLISLVILDDIGGSSSESYWYNAATGKITITATRFYPDSPCVTESVKIRVVYI